jgi:hypothetical protein
MVLLNRLDKEEDMVVMVGDRDNLVEYSDNFLIQGNVDTPARP